MLDRDMSIFIPASANDDGARMEHDFRELGRPRHHWLEQKAALFLISSQVQSYQTPARLPFHAPKKRASKSTLYS